MKLVAALGCGALLGVAGVYVYVVWMFRNGPQ